MKKITGDHLAIVYGAVIVTGLAIMGICLHLLGLFGIELEATVMVCACCALIFVAVPTAITWFLIWLCNQVIEAITANIKPNG